MSPMSETHQRTITDALTALNAAILAAYEDGYEVRGLRALSGDWNRLKGCASVDPGFLLCRKGPGRPRKPINTL
jgi:hypothetical protein